MIQWRISEFVDSPDGVSSPGVVSEWFDEKSRKNKGFRTIQVKFQAKLDMIRTGGPDMVVGAIGGTSFSAHIDKIKAKGRLSILVFFVRGPDSDEITLVGASVEKDKKLIEPGIENRAISRQETLKKQPKGWRKPYVYYCP